MCPCFGALAGRLSCQSCVRHLGGVPQELGATFLFGGVPDPVGRHRKSVQGPQKSPVGFVLPWDRTRPSPACPAERIKSAVVTRSGIRVGSDVSVAGVQRERFLGEQRPTQAGRRMLANKVHELLSAALAEGRRGRILRQPRRFRASARGQQVPIRRRSHRANVVRPTHDCRSTAGPQQR